MDLNQLKKISKKMDNTYNIIHNFNGGYINDISIVNNEIKNYQLKVLNELEKIGFNKKVYLKILIEIEKLILSDINHCNSSFILSKTYTNLISDCIVKKYSNFLSENYFINFLKKIIKNIDEKKLQKKLFSFYFIFIKRNISFGIFEIINLMDYDYYEYRFNQIINDEDSSKFSKEILIHNDKKYFSNVKDIFIF